MSSTAAELIQEAKIRADMEKSQFISDPQWLIWISDGYLALYDLLVSSFEDYYSIENPNNPMTPDANGILTLPADFYKFAGLDRLDGGSNPLTVRPFNFQERNRLSSIDVPSGVYPKVRYSLFGQSKIYLKPASSSAGQYNLWYVPRGVKVTSQATVIDGINGWENYISLTASVKAAKKEESEWQGLQAEVNEIVARITEMAAHRDLVADGGRIRDVRSSDIRRGSSYGSVFDDGG